MKIILLLLTFLPILHFAQMETDRPGEGTASTIIFAKTIQLESGIIYNRNEKGFTSDHLLRFGLTERWEVRLQTIQNLSDSSESTYGFSSKYNFLKGEDYAPSLTLIADSDFKFEDYSFILASDKQLTENFGSSAGIGYVKENLQDFYFLSFGLDYSFTDRLGIFTDHYGYFNSNLSPEHGVDFGLTYLAAPRLQLDVSVGSNPQNISEEYYLSTGISYRFR
ncbi:transporter [Kaistella antarctica]|uniref:Transporter n=1 Tax=Kaistella antarctica TaxID=266748 RepID=A0A3S4VGP7_9FLAO|nr:transporter [Kaistella antarctica]KEY18467.1 hypothetical protein HY04_08090 [Kaistella antarctica]SEV86050.1 Putative MetA-pathway of phenol degradation [Kaistella antarctica]VEI01260.1 Uncharacterised protein [Kaistella antarctica]